MKVNLFQLSFYTNSISYVLWGCYKVCGFRWKIEQYNREVKQITGIAKCQARNSKAQHKHIITSILSWIVRHVQVISRKNNYISALEILQRNIWQNPYTAFSRWCAKVLTELIKINSGNLLPLRTIGECFERYSIHHKSQKI